MIAFMRKKLTCLILKPNSNNVWKSRAYLYQYSKNLSASSGSEAVINHKLSSILVHKHNFDPKFVSRVASELTHFKNPEKVGLTLSFLKDIGFPDHHLEKIVKTIPRLLTSSLENVIKPKIKFFQDMGLSYEDISKMISRHPGILELSLDDNIIPSVALLERLLGSNDKAARLIRMASRILPTNLENTMLPNVEFLESCGVPMERIRIVLTSFPNPFLLKPESMRKSADKAREMGVDATSNSFIYAVSTIASMSSEGWFLKLQAVRSLGFSDGDIVIMFRKAPQVFAVSAEKMKKIKQLLLGTGKYALSSIVEHPKCLSNSVEKRYVPRLHILGILERRDLIRNWPSLRKISQLSDDKFFKEFISPYSDEVSSNWSLENSARGERR